MKKQNQADNDLNSKDKKSKKCMYSRQNMNFINDEWPSDDGGLHMKLHTDQFTNDQLNLNKSGLNSDSLLVSNHKSKFNETNF